MLFALVYLLLRRLVQRITGSPNELLETEVEVVVLRHQLKVLQRQLGRPRLRRSDRLFMAALSRVLPRGRWSAFAVSPRRSFGGTGSSCGGSGPSVGNQREADHRSPTMFETSSCRWEGRTPGGDASGSAASSPSLASGSRRRRSGRCYQQVCSVRLPARRVSGLHLPLEQRCRQRRLALAPWPRCLLPCTRTARHAAECSQEGCFGESSPHSCSGVGSYITRPRLCATSSTQRPLWRLIDIAGSNAINRSLRGSDRPLPR